MKTFQDELAGLGGLWQYKDGARYLALLASGKISNAFVNCGLLTTYPSSLDAWTDRLAVEVNDKTEELDFERDEDAHVLSVIGPGMGGITLAYSLASQFHTGALGHTPASAFDDVEFMAFFTEPYEKDGVKLQKFRFELPKNGLVLLCEDVITTGTSVQKTLDAICEANPVSLVPVVACLVDRRADKGLLNLKITKASRDEMVSAEVVSLLSITPKTWDSLEAARIDHPNVVEAIRPKANWSKLIGG